MDALKSLPDSGGAARYRLIRASGGDKLMPVQEENGTMEGCLELKDDEKSSSAMFYAKFPDDKGILAGRLDNTGIKEHNNGPPTYFEALACRAYLNYGSWHGMLHRDGDMIGARFVGSTVLFATHDAIVGSPDSISAAEPYVFEIIHSVKVLEDEPEPMEDEEDYIPLKVGDLGFTFFFKSKDIGHGVSTPITLWFQQQRDDDKEGPAGIPNLILEEIRKLPQRGAAEKETKNGKKRARDNAAASSMFS